jgi:hypothetical protein
MRWASKELWFDSWYRLEIYSFSKHIKNNSSVAQSASFQGVLGREADHVPPSSAKVKNYCSCTFMAYTKTILLYFIFTTEFIKVNENIKLQQ